MLDAILSERYTKWSTKKRKKEKKCMWCHPIFLEIQEADPPKAL